MSAFSDTLPFFNGGDWLITWKDLGSNRLYKKHCSTSHGTH